MYPPAYAERLAPRNQPTLKNCVALWPVVAAEGIADSDLYNGEMHSRFPTITLLITSAIYAGFAVWLGLRPAALLAAFGIESTTPQMLTEIRAFYGGIELAIAVVMLLLWRRGDIFAGLLIGGLPLAGSASGRCVGLVLDGFSTLHASLAAIEAMGCIFCLAGCLAVSKAKD